MKKLLFILGFLLPVVLYGQNTFKYPVNANGGLRVGGSDHTKIDSIKAVGTHFSVWNGSTDYFAISDTTGLKYIDGLTSDAQDQLDDITADIDTLQTDTVDIDDLTVMDTLRNSVKYIYNILDYGAISGDGLSDVAAIQEAIDSAYACMTVNPYLSSIFSGYSPTVVIPGGEWDIDAPDTLRNHLYIKIDRKARFHSSHDGAIWVAPAQQQLMNCRVDGGDYIGPRTTEDGYPNSKCIDLCSPGILLGHAYNYFSNMSMQRFSKAIHTRFTTGGYSNANSFDNIYMDRNRVCVHLETNGNIVSNCMFQTNSSDYYDTIVIVNGGNDLFTSLQLYDIDDRDSVVAVYCSSTSSHNYFNIPALIINQRYCLEDYGSSNIFIGNEGMNIKRVELQTHGDSDNGYLTFKRIKDGDPTYDVANGSILGSIDFYGYYTDAYYKGGEIRTTVSAVPGVNDMGCAMAFYVSPDGSATPAVYYTIGSDEVRFSKPPVPATSDLVPLGSTARMWSDLYLASGGVINCNNSDVTLTHATNNVTLDGGNLTIGDDFSIIQQPNSTGEVVDATGITAAMLSGVIYYSEAAATDITADPQIADGTAGQIITIVGSSDTNTLTLDDGAGLRLSGQMVLGIGDVITLLYVQLIGDWVEISRSNN